MAIAVTPEPPRDRWDRVGSLLLAAVALLVLGLFVFGMLDAYAF